MQINLEKDINKKMKVILEQVKQSAHAFNKLCKLIEITINLEKSDEAQKLLSQEVQTLMEITYSNFIRKNAAEAKLTFDFLQVIIQNLQLQNERVNMENLQKEAEKILKKVEQTKDIQNGENKENSND